MRSIGYPIIWLSVDVLSFASQPSTGGLYKVKTGLEHDTQLPVRRSLTVIYAFSLLIAVLMAAASVAGLAYTSAVYPADELVRAFVPNDVTNLFIGLPILLGSLWLARRGRWLGLLCWPGALFYVLYNYLVYALAMPFGVAFLLHLALVTLSVYALIALVASMDAKAIQQRLSGAVPERLAGGILAGLGFLFFVRLTGVLVSALSTHTPLAGTELALHISDFLTTPAWIIGGVLLWRRRELGYVAGLGLLFQASMLFIALVVFLLLQPLLTTAPLVVTDVVVILMMGLVCFIPFALFARGVMSRRGWPLA
jgi:hypothetical protein